MITNYTEMNNAPAITAIIVTHNSPVVLRRVVEALLVQSLPLSRIIIVDSGSTDSNPVKELTKLDQRIAVICRSNIGFAAANNLAMQHYLEKTDYFVLVNPDAVLSPDWILGAHAYIDSPAGGHAGIVSSPLRGMDVISMRPTECWDTLGIYRALSGRWRDMGMRERIEDLPAPLTPYQPSAICGALMFFSAAVYRDISKKHGFFDEKLHTFKEDIEVSLRVRRKGYNLIMLPQLTAWHCRGWPQRRWDTSYWARKMSARNEVIIAARYSIATLPLYFLKYLYVTSIERWIMKFAPR
jgi:N-acetylglucosaminyl-diphospho-decaprenol L-rhamnosyltransferase